MKCRTNLRIKPRTTNENLTTSSSPAVKLVDYDFMVSLDQAYKRLYITSITKWINFLNVDVAKLTLVNFV